MKLMRHIEQTTVSGTDIKGLGGRRKKLLKGSFVVGALIMSLALTGCGQAKAEEVAVEAPVVKNTVEAFGVVKSKNVANVLIEFAANLNVLNVREGQTVRKGDVLAVMDMSNYTSQIKAKEIDVRKAELEKQKLLHTNTLTLDNDPSYTKLVEAAKLAGSQLETAEKDMADNKALLDSGAVSQRDYDKVKEEYNQKKKAYSDARIDVEQYKKNKKALANDIEIRGAEAESARIMTEGMEAKLNKDYIQGGNIVCPYDQAVVYDIGYAAGDTVNLDKKLFSIADSKELIVEADITEEFVGEIVNGAEVVITPVADKTKSYKGKVTRIYDMAKVKNNETVVPIEITIENNDGFLKPNFNVDVSIKKPAKK